MKRLFAAATVFAAAATALPAAAQFAKQEDAVKYRQSALFVIGQHFGRLGAMANGKAPYDAKAAVDNAQVVADMARLPWAGFVAGADSRRAKPEIWKDGAKFKEHADKMVAESQKLLTAAKVGNVDALKAAFGPTAGTCKGCHDAFRAD